MLRSLLLMLLSVIATVAPAVAQPDPARPGPPARSVYLEQASHGVDTLQSWYTQGTGLYRTTGWWNSGNAITVLANYSRVGRTEAYFPVFANTLQQAQTTYSGFLNNYLDDEGWWALAWIDAYDLTHKPEYLVTAASIFTDMTGLWDNTCGGGIWWDKTRTYKNAIANELFLSVAAHLTNRASNGAQRAEYLGWAQKEWSWFANSGMINAQNLVNDGLDQTTCKNNGRTTWSYNQGVVLGGLTELSAATHNPTLTGTAKSIADATLAHLADSNGVLHDTCEPSCGADGVQFKGIFLRNLMALQEAVHDPRYKVFADTNAESIWKTSQGPKYQFGQVWSGPFDAGNAASQSSALDAFIAAAAMDPPGPGR